MNKNINIIKKWLDLRDGTISRECERRKTLSDILTESSFLENMVLSHTYEHVFSKMLSSLEWHPNQNQLLIGSRGGDVSSVDIKSGAIRQCCRGGGRGQQITDIKFDGLDTNWFFTSSTSGKVMKQRLDGREDIILNDSEVSEPFSSSVRYSCLDVCSDRKLLISGDSKGCIHLMASCESTKKGINYPIHTSNVLHCEFNKFNTNLFVSASIDCSVKFWDIRHIKKPALPVLTIRQNFPLNSASFSLTNGSTLLITNCFDEISVYRGPDWQLERCIRHNHEQTHRFSLLKAKWHPFLDLFTIGSFSSDPLVSGQYCDRPQALDVIEVNTGSVKSSFSDGNPGVISAGAFNSTGDVIAAIKGQNLIVFESKAKD